MNEFVSAALPWVLAGLALAILAANHSIERQKDEKRGARIATGAGLGLVLGTALSSCGWWHNHTLGLLLGILWGMALASLYRGGDTPEDKNDPDAR
ncbi:MAG: hypothetical protein ACI3U8_00955 [Candidatus Onthomonas sp.]